MKKLLCLIALLSTASVVAQPRNVSTSLILFKYNLNSTTEIFCSHGIERFVPDGTVASAASTAWTAGSGTPYLNVAVGDYVRATQPPGSASVEKSVVARASSTAITASNAVSITGWPAESNPTLTTATLVYRPLACGTTSEDGKFSVSGADRFSITVAIRQVVATGGIDLRIQCRTNPRAPWLQVLPALTPPTQTASYLNYATATPAVLQWASADPYSDCRVGLKIGSADDGADTGTASEQISIWLTTRS